MSTISLQRVLAVVRDFDCFGGASMGLVAWELSVEPADVADAWREACERGLLAPTDQPDHAAPEEDVWRLTESGWAGLGISPVADRDRRQTIATLGILDGIEDPGLSALIRLTAHVTGAKSAALHIFDERYQHRIAALNAPLGSHPAHDSMCRLVVDGHETVVVSDATADQRFAFSSFTAADPPVRFYAAAPLRTSGEGAVVGTLCAFDSVARDLDAQQVERLHDLARLAISHLEMGRISSGLDSLATRDPLTGVAARLLLPDRLAQAQARRQRYGGAVVVVLVEIENLDAVIARHGGPAGDDVLATTAARLTATLRAEDTVARLGANQFVTLAEIDPATGGDTIERMRESLRRPIAWGSALLELTVAVGAAVAQPDDDVLAVLARAGAELYRQ